MRYLLDTNALLYVFRIGMGRHLNCGGDFGAKRRCFGELSKKQDDDMDNLRVWGQSPRKAHFTRGSCVMPLSIEWGDTLF